MDPTPLFLIQFLWFALVWSTIGRLVVWPWSLRLALDDAVAAWVLPQTFRVFGVGLLVPQLSPGLSHGFALSTALGDGLTAVLALSALVALRTGHAQGRALAWACTVFGGLDLLVAMTQAARVQAALHLEAQWYVPVVGVPLMLVAHVGCAATLLRTRGGPARP